MSSANSLDEAFARGDDSFGSYFRCPPGLVSVEAPTGDVSRNSGYFQFHGVTCFGRLAHAGSSASPGAGLVDAALHVTRTGDRGVRLPFDLDELSFNLRFERYSHGVGSEEVRSHLDILSRLYYAVRPALPVGIRKHLQRLRLAGWEQIQFPSWPVDVSLDALMAQVMGEVLRAGGSDPIPFIWFWPDGAPGCSVVTHDVEDSSGRDFVQQLMDVDEQAGIESSFQLVPEGRGNALQSLAGVIRKRGFELNIHDLNHDGRLFAERGEFLKRASRINGYVKAFGCDGFRSGAMYRNQRWFSAFDFAYDMSVPNVAHLEPQRGGCCTVLPYFIGRIVELPLTTIQDYSLFHILGDYSIALWKCQIEAILERNGLISVIAHPDYLRDGRAMRVYQELLAYLGTLRVRRRIWIALPGEVNQWWRQRQKMVLVRHGNGWRVEGPGSQRARVAYAVLDRGAVSYRVESVDEGNLQ